MLKSIWKGIKWFFTVKEKTHNGIARKHGHIVRQPSRVDPPIKVTGPTGQTVSIDSYNRMAIIHKSISNGQPDDVIESAKRELWIPHSITQEHKELILANCGFQKVEIAGVMTYDPRLIQAVTYAMNMYAGEVSARVESILQRTSVIE